MMRFLRKLNDIKVVHKIALLVFLPLLLVFSFVVTDVQQKWQTQQEMSELQELSLFATKISAVVHETQKERGATGVYMGSGGKKFLQELNEQRQLTDQKMADLQRFLERFDAGKYGSEFERQLQTTMEWLVGLQELRRKATALSIEPKEAIDYYTQTNASVLRSVNVITTLTDNKKAVSLINAYVNFMKGKEKAGVERAVMSAVFAADRFDDGERFLLFISLMASQESYFEVFDAFATPEQKELYNTTKRNKVVDDVKHMRAIAIDKGMNGGFGVDAAMWFNAQTARINLLKRVENKLAEDLNSATIQLKTDAVKAFIFSGIVCVLAVICVILSIAIARSIAQPLGQLFSEVCKIAETGDLSGRVNYNSKDELGLTVGAFNQFMGLLETTVGNINHVMGAVAQGDFKKRINMETVGDLETLKSRINKTVKALDEGLSGINVTMGAVAKGDLKKRVEVDAEGDLLSLKDNINLSIAALAETIGNVAQNSDLVFHGASQTNSALAQTNDAIMQTNIAISEVAQGSQKQLDSINDLAAALGQTTATVGHVAEGAKSASQSAREALGIVHSGKEKMKEMVMVAHTMAENSSRINNITEMLSRIAAQTNLLALNSSVEAARAGEEGRGFAVVAEEVRNLAGDSAKSADDITTLVTEAVVEAEKGVLTAGKVSDEMEKIVSAVAQSDETMQPIAQAMEEQSVVLQQLTSHVTTLRTISESNAVSAEQISASSEGLAATAQEIGATATELARRAEETQGQVGVFNV